MSVPILATKLYIPTPTSNLVPRPRLHQKLEQGLEKKLTLISAPAGFGKTTLLGECIADCGRPAAWFSLDEGDNDPTLFFVYIIAALQTLEPNIGAGILKILSSPQRVPITSILTDLINEITNTLGQFVLVLDDYHLIESEEIDEALSFIIDHIPPRMSLVISSRTDPTLPLPRLRACGHLAEIREKDLRFTLEEVGQYLETAMGITISAENLVALESRTEGWITGLQLAALSMQGLKNPDDINAFVDHFSSSHRYILDYLTDEVLRRRPEGTREFLLQTSILNRLSAPLCQAVTEIENSQDILETLDAANLFLIRLDDERLWYRYHHLFDDLLQKRLARSQPEMVPVLHLRAARWYRQNGLISDALEHLLAAGDYRGAADLVELNARDLLDRSELATLIKWVGALPETQVQKRPWLCVYHAWALRLSGAPFAVVESHIEEAGTAIKRFGKRQKEKTSTEEVTAPVNQLETLNMHIAALRAFQHLYKEEIPSVLALTQQAYIHDFEENFVRGMIAFARGWALRFSGDLEKAYQALEDTKNFSLASGNIYMAVAGSCRAAYGRVLGGELHQAYDDFREAVNLATAQDGRLYPVAGYAYVYMGGILYEWNDLETARRYLLEGIELCMQVGYIMDQVVGLVNLALLQKILGDWDAALEAVRKANHLRQKMKSYIYVRRWVDNCQIRLWHAQGAQEEINRWIRTCGLRTDDDLDYNRDLEHVILARALVYSGVNQTAETGIQEALTLLGRLLGKAEAAKWWGRAIEILVLQSLAFQASGDRQEALNTLARALTLAEPEGYIRTFIDEGEPMHRLMAELRTRIVGQKDPKVPSSERYVGRLLVEFEREKNGKLGQRTAAENQPIVEPLSSRELEVLHLMADGMTNQEIAGKLVIALTTAKKHVSNIIGKLGVKNRTQAVARARELNLL